MGGRVKVVEGEDAVAPGAEAAVAREPRLAAGCVVGVIHVVVDEHGQRRVRDPAVVVELVRLDAHWSAKGYRSGCASWIVPEQPGGGLELRGDDLSEG